MKQVKTNSIKETFDFLKERVSLLNLNQVDFVKELKKYYSKNKELSVRQQNVLIEIKKHLKFYVKDAI